jgi:four helix bundle protein
MEKFRTLKAWQKSHELVLAIYKARKSFPPEERFVLIPQITRASISVAANLAEGTKRKSVLDQKHFFNMAETSLEEVKYYLILAGDLRYISGDELSCIMELSQDVGRLTSGLVNKPVLTS